MPFDYMVVEVADIGHDGTKMLPGIFIHDLPALRACRGMVNGTGLKL